MKYIPNLLTIIRMILIPIFVICFFLVSPLLAMALFLLAGATDVLDGYLARRNGWITTLGKLLDPVADKSMQCAVLIVLVVSDTMPFLLALPFILKEVILLCCGVWFWQTRDDVSVSRWYGKMAICLFYLTACLTILSSVVPTSWQGMTVLLMLLWIMTLLSMLGALAGYIVCYAKIARKTKKNRKDTSLVDG